MHPIIHPQTGLALHFMRGRPRVISARDATITITLPRFQWGVVIRTVKWAVLGAVGKRSFCDAHSGKGSRLPYRQTALSFWLKTLEAVKWTASNVFSYDKAVRVMNFLRCFPRVQRSTATTVMSESVLTHIQAGIWHQTCGIEPACDPFSWCIKISINIGQILAIHNND